VVLWLRQLEGGKSMFFQQPAKLASAQLPNGTIGPQQEIKGMKFHPAEQSRPKDIHFRK
jgi:hypothetical protein